MVMKKGEQIMILVCDLGNTNVVFGFYEKDTFISSFRLVSSNLMGLDEYVAKLNSVIKDKNIDISKIEGAIMSSVMPSISKIIKDAIKKYFSFSVIFSLKFSFHYIFLIL